MRGLWHEKQGDCYLIAPHHLNLGDDSIASDLTSRLDRPAFRQVIEADIASPRTGTLAHAGAGQGLGGRRQAVFGRRVATAVFLHSLVQTGQSGVDPADLRLAVLQPATSRPWSSRRPFSTCTDHCWFFDYDGRRYRFKTPSRRYARSWTTRPAWSARPRRRASWTSGSRRCGRRASSRRNYFPAEASEVDDDTQRPEAGRRPLRRRHRQGDPGRPPPGSGRQAVRAKGSLEEYRTCKNNLLFLVADADQVGRLVEVTQRYLAVQRIVADPDRMSDFNKEQKDKLRKIAEAAELELRVAITKAYRHLYYPSADAPRSSAGLASAAPAR